MTGGDLFLEGEELRAIGCRSFTAGECFGEVALDLAPFAANRRHQDRFDQGENVFLARVVRADLRALGAFERALEECAHDTRLDELPIRFGRSGERADFFFVQLKDGCFFEKMTVEMLDLIFAESAASRHRGKKFLERFGEMFGIVHAAFENLGHDARRKQAGVFGEETKDDAVEESRDAQVLSLRDGMFLARLSVGQFNRFTFL